MIYSNTKVQLYYLQLEVIQEYSYIIYKLYNSIAVLYTSNTIV